MRRLNRSDRSVLLFGAFAAVLAFFAEGAPTGIEMVDLGYRGAYGFVLAVAGARARRWTWFVAGGVAGVVGAGSPVALGASVAALGCAFASFVAVRRQRELGAVVGGVAAFALLSLPTDFPTAVPTLVATLTPLPLVISGLANTASPRRYFAAVGAAIVVAAGATALFVVAMIQVQSSASDGLDAARQGLDAASDGDDATSASAFAEAERSLSKAERAANAWWLAPARALPILAPHIEAVRHGAGAAQDIAALGAEQLSTLDLSGLSDADGTISLARVADFTPRASRVLATLTDAKQALDATESPWLVTPARERLDRLEAVVDRVVPTAQNASDILRIAPEVLGATEPKHYVVLVGNPAEARELGGFVAGVGYLTADRGALDFTTVGGTTALNERIVASGATVAGDLPAPLGASSPDHFVQNWSNTADFALVNDVVSQLGAEITGGTVDGTIYLDPFVLAALLRITGPVEVDGLSEPLTSDQAADFFLREQYALPALEEDGDRKDRLRDAAEAAFQRLTSMPLPDPRVIADVLAPSTRGRRLLFSTSDPEHHELFERAGLRPPLDVGATDQLLVTVQNLRSNKLDAYLSRTVSYDLDIDERGVASGTVSVSLTNDAPETGLDPYVTGDDALDRSSDPLPETLHRTSVAVYTRLQVLAARIDGAAVGFANSEHTDLWRSATRVDIPSGSTVVAEFDVSGVLPSLDPGGYRLALVPTASARATTVDATIRVGDSVIRQDPIALDATVDVGG